MRSLLAPAAALLLAHSAAAQTVDDWLTALGNQPVAWVVADSTGHVYAIDGRYNAYRIAPDGTILWSRRLDVGGPNNHERSFQCVVDSEDAVIVCGYSEDTGEYMTVKWDTQGAMQWAHLFRDGDFDEAYRIGIDATDNVYVTGHSYLLANFSRDFLTISIDPAGNTRWVRRLDVGGSEQPTALDILPDGTTAITGHAGGSTVLTVSYDGNGTELWWNTYYPSIVPGNAVGIASDGAAYVCGVGVGAGLVLCYGPTGVLEWELEHNRPSFPGWSNYRRMAVRSDDKVVVCGQADGAGAYTDWSVVCADRQGNVVWEDYVSGFESNDEWAEAITVGADDAVYVGGKVCNNTTSTWLHGMIMKYDRHGARQWEHHFSGGIVPGSLALDVVERVLAGLFSGVARVTDTSKLQLRVDGLVAGGTTTVSGANAAFSETVHFVFSLTGVGDGLCPAALGGLCLDLRLPIRQVGSATADVNGVATVTAPVPPGGAGLPVFVQAAVARGPGGAGSLSSNVVAAIVQ